MPPPEESQMGWRLGPETVPHMSLVLGKLLTFQQMESEVSVVLAGLGPEQVGRGTSWG